MTPINTPMTRMTTSHGSSSANVAVSVRVAAIAVARLSVPPTDRSMPPRRTTIVWPVAMRIRVIASDASMLQPAHRRASPAA